MTTKRTDNSTDPKPDAGQAPERKTILASEVGLVAHDQRRNTEGV